MWYLCKAGLGEAQQLRCGVWLAGVPSRIIRWHYCCSSRRLCYDNQIMGSPCACNSKSVFGLAEPGDNISTMMDPQLYSHNTQGSQYPYSDRAFFSWPVPGTASSEQLVSKDLGPTAPGGKEEGPVAEPQPNITIPASLLLVETRWVSYNSCSVIFLFSSLHNLPSSFWWNSVVLTLRYHAWSF